MLIFCTCLPRSGSQAMYGFLDHQEDIYARHETRGLPWDFSEEAYEQAKTVFAKMESCSEENYSAEVNFSLVPYIFQLKKDFPDSKFIFLKREKDAHRKSFNRHFIETSNLNYLVAENSSHWDDKYTKNESDHCYPSYDLCIDDAFNKYYDEAHETMDKFMEQYPDSYIVYENFSILNSISEQKKLMDFIGIEKKSANYFHKYYYDKANSNDAEGHNIAVRLHHRWGVNSELSVSDKLSKTLFAVSDSITNQSYLYRSNKSLFFKSRFYTYLFELDFSGYFPSTYLEESKKINDIYDDKNGIFYNFDSSDDRLQEYLNSAKKFIESSYHAFDKFSELNEKEDLKSVLKDRSAADNAIHLILDNLVRIELSLKFLFANYDFFNNKEAVEKLLGEDTWNVVSPLDALFASMDIFKVIPAILRIKKTEFDDKKSLRPFYENALSLFARRLYQNKDKKESQEAYFSSMIEEMMKEIIEMETGNKAEV